VVYSRFEWAPYVPVAQRRANAARLVAGMRKKGTVVRPVHIEGKKITTSAWGNAWCQNLEAYSDYANRLPRGRTYVRNGSVVDLAIEAGKVRAMVSGSDVYRISVTIAPLSGARWKAIVHDTSGRIESVVGLLRGRLDAGVMARMTDPARGLFPAPSEIKLSCSCPDWAALCKHVAATLYGVGARLDAEPELLFVLRGVDHRQLIAAGAKALAGAAAAAPAAPSDASLGALFGIEIGGDEEAPQVVAPPPGVATPARGGKAATASPSEPGPRVAKKTGARSGKTTGARSGKTAGARSGKTTGARSGKKTGAAAKSPPTARKAPGASSIRNRPAAPRSPQRPAIAARRASRTNESADLAHAIAAAVAAAARGPRRRPR